MNLSNIRDIEMNVKHLTTKIIMIKNEISDIEAVWPAPLTDKVPNWVLQKHRDLCTRMQELENDLQQATNARERYIKEMYEQS